MMFAMSIDPETYLYTFDEDGDIREMLRPKAVPTESVSPTIPRIIRAIKIAFDKGLSRSYALVGKPGTGKTIGAQQISNAYPNICTFKISADVITDSDQADAMLRYVKAIKKCIIILDDMDSYTLDEKNDNVVSYLGFFDKLNQAAKNDQVSYIFFATINDPKKVNQRIMRRSGRIDEMFEIGLPSIDTMRYLFKYNDEKINPDNLTDFNDPKFDGVFQLAADAHITAADVTNIFTDIVIYSGSVESMDENGEVIEPTKEEDVEICTPEKIRDAIERIKGRNQMSGRSFIDSERDED
jgi:SpoVK/Ycf46/Vps4 family AAA+-type ATPase